MPRGALARIAASREPARIAWSSRADSLTRRSLSAGRTVGSADRADQRDDRDHDQEFDQGEPARAGSSCRVHQRTPVLTPEML